jgi:hypothetical protein
MESEPNDTAPIQSVMRSESEVRNIYDMLTARITHDMNATSRCSNSDYLVQQTLGWVLGINEDLNFKYNIVPILVDNDDSKGKVQ